MAPTGEPMGSLRRNRVNLLLMFLVLAVGTVTGLLALPQTGSPLAPDRGAATAVTSSDTSYTMGISGSGTPEVTSFVARQGACPYNNPACTINEGTDVGVLPAWRWSNVELDGDDGGFLGKFKEIPIIIAELFFNLANFIWRILLAVLRIGFNARDLLRIATGAINSGFAFMARNLLMVGVAMAVFGLWRIVKAFFNSSSGGGVVKGMRTMFGFLFGFAAIIGIMVQSRVAVVNHPGAVDEQLEVAGTLPWAAHEILNLADKVTNPIVSVVTGATVSTDPGAVPVGTRINNGTSCAGGTDTYIAGQISGDFDGDGTSESFDACGGGDTAVVNTCANYLNALRNAYTSGPGNERTLVLVSRLWEGTLYESWKSATFGPPVNYRRADGERVASDIPERVMCHWAEAVNGTSVGSQYATSKAAYGTDAFPQETVPFVFNAATGRGNADTHATRRAMTMWAACDFDGSTWVGHRDFDGAWKGDDKVDENVYDSLCPTVMNTGSYIDGQYPSKIESLPLDKQSDVKAKFYFFTGSVGDAVSGGEAKSDQLRAARSYGKSFTGANAGGRILYGLTSVVVALLFAWSLGMVGIGLVGAILMAIAALVFGIPIALALVSIGKTDKAMPLFRATLSSLLAHSFFTIVLTAIIILTGIFQALVMGLGGLQGMIAALLKGSAPLAAFILVRKMLKALGMADILTATGAMTFAGAAAAAASGDKRLQAMARVDSSGRNAMQRSMSKVPWLGKRIDRFDRMSPTRANWSRAGRARRRELNEQEKAEREQRRQEREERVRDRQGQIDRAHQQGRQRPWQELRNMFDRGRIRASEATRGRWEEILDTYKTLRNDGSGVTSGFSWAVWQGVTGYGKAGRPIGMPVEEEESVPMDTTPGEIIGGRDAEPRRTENAKAVDDHIRQAIEEALQGAGDLDSADRFRLISEVIGENIADMYYTYAESICGQLDGNLSLEEINGVKLDLAAKTGYAPEQILVTVEGVPVVEPYSPERARAELSPEQLRNFVHFLPEEDRQPQRIGLILPDGTATLRMETEDEFASRLVTLGFARGYLNPDGTSVDVLAANGIDVNTPNDRARVERWKEGQSDALLDSLRVGAIDDALEARMIEATRRRISKTYERAVQEFEQKQQEQRTREDAWRRGEPLVAGTAVVTPVTGREAAPPLDLSGLSQIALAVTAAREVLEATRRQNGDVVKAAERMSATMDRLEKSQASLIGNLEQVMVDNLERELAAMDHRGELTAQRFEEVFSRGVAGVEEAIGQVGDILEGFRNGVTSFEDAISDIGKVVETVNRTNNELGEQLRENVGTIIKQMNTMGGGRPNTAQYTTMESSRRFVSENGSPMPEEGR